MLYKMLGVWLMADGIASLLLVADKKVLWQLARLIRVGVGIAVFMI